MLQLNPIKHFGVGGGDRTTGGEIRIQTLTPGPRGAEGLAIAPDPVVYWNLETSVR